MFYGLGCGMWTFYLTPFLDPVFVSFFSFTGILARALSWFFCLFLFRAFLRHLLDFRRLGRFPFLLPGFLEIISLLMIPIFTPIF